MSKIIEIDLGTTNSCLNTKSKLREEIKNDG